MTFVEILTSCFTAIMAWFLTITAIKKLSSKTKICASEMTLSVIFATCCLLLSLSRLARKSQKLNHHVFCSFDIRGKFS